MKFRDEFSLGHGIRAVGGGAGGGGRRRRGRGRLAGGPLRPGLRPHDPHADGPAPSAPRRGPRRARARTRTAPRPAGARPSTTLSRPRRGATDCLSRPSARNGRLSLATALSGSTQSSSPTRGSLSPTRATSSPSRKPSRPSLREARGGAGSRPSVTAPRAPRARAGAADSEPRARGCRRRWHPQCHLLGPTLPLGFPQAGPVP